MVIRLTPSLVDFANVSNNELKVFWQIAIRFINVVTTIIVDNYFKCSKKSTGPCDFRSQLIAGSGR